ncbi:unnamed protein product [Schistosoma mattheei]|uniref:Uncharacterized protein n=1 Tax=Schistosoma mattheei TaxID=31246 RepID=A0AA85BQV6_9TREM|nr:unnamed protein product [Schistosoma mattheei]
MFTVVNFTSVIHVFRHVKCFKCDKNEHSKSVCRTVYFAASNVKLCNSYPISLSDSNNHILSLFTTYSNSLHIQKRLYLSSDAFMILLLKLKVSNPSFQLES